MVPSPRGLFKRDGIFVTLDVHKDEGYSDVAKKAAEVLSIEGDVTDLRLFRSRGAMIPFSDEWTVASHKRKIHLGPDFVQLGVGLLGKGKVLLAVVNYIQSLIILFINIRKVYLLVVALTALMPQWVSIVAD